MAEILISVVGIIWILLVLRAYCQEEEYIEKLKELTKEGDDCFGTKWRN